VRTLEVAVFHEDDRGIERPRDVIALAHRYDQLG
jgi:hypothetical protein